MPLSTLFGRLECVLQHQVRAALAKGLRLERAGGLSLGAVRPLHVDQADVITQKAQGVRPEMQNFGFFCAEGILGQFWRACRRRPNLAVGDAACNNLKWLVETTKPKRGVYSQAILQ